LLRLALAGVRFAGVREPLTLVRQRPGSLSRSNMSTEDMRVALANVHRLRREYPGRISVAMIARCWLRSLGWVTQCQVRDLIGTLSTPLPGYANRSVRPPVAVDSVDS